MRWGRAWCRMGSIYMIAAPQRIEIQWVQGIGSDKAAAPQARLMATVINGILNRQLPWRLVLLGVFLVISIELLGVRSLPFAVGAYLSIATTAAIFAGRRGALAGRALAAARRGRRNDVGPGSALCQRTDRRGRNFWSARNCASAAAGSGVPLPHFPAGLFQIGPKILGRLASSDALGVVMFLLLCGTQFFFARKKLE